MTMQPINNAYDVIIVGARCAGAATAMLLAALGLRVLVFDKNRLGTDTVSTHALMRPAVLLLHRALMGISADVLNATQMPLAEVPAGVPGIMQHVGQVGCLIGEPGVIALNIRHHPVGVWPLPGYPRGARRGAKWRDASALGEQHAICGEAVEIGRLDHRAPGAAQGGVMLLRNYAGPPLPDEFLFFGIEYCDQIKVSYGDNDIVFFAHVWDIPVEQLEAVGMGEVVNGASQYSGPSAPHSL